MALKMLLAFVLLLWTVNAQSHQGPVRVASAVVSDGSGSSSSCPSTDLLQSARANLSDAVRQTLDSPCGEVGWTQVINLDMSDPSQQCPSPWELFTSPARSCSEANLPGCYGFNISVRLRTYSRVCGRVTGHGRGNPNAFADHHNIGLNIDIGYLDGLSLTHGSPRQHIWSFASGHALRPMTCPCDNSNRTLAPLPLPFVGNNYFCDSLRNGALWDGENCVSNCCIFNSPPYFTATLPVPASDNLEVRLCGDEIMSNEPVYISLLQLYVR